jgi:serine kinase of HPr protein (carbohydrate metabolism regulator)
MRTPILSSETIHASAVAIAGRVVLIYGQSGRGKSDLALRLIDRGARLVSDDYTIVRRVGGLLVATAAPNIAGKIEVRGVGIVELPHDSDVPVGMILDLDRQIERLPEADETRMLAGIAVPVIGFAALEASAPLKAEAALRKFGLTAS